MSEIAERYKRLAAALTDKVEGVPNDAWDNPSPCADWTARDIVEHMVGHTGMFLGFIGKKGPELPSVADDPVKAWTASRDAMQVALDDPSIAEAEYDGAFGKSTF